MKPEKLRFILKNAPLATSRSIYVCAYICIDIYIYIYTQYVHIMRVFFLSVLQENQREASVSFFLLGGGPSKKPAIMSLYDDLHFPPPAKFTWLINMDMFLFVQVVKYILPFA